MPEKAGNKSPQDIVVRLLAVLIFPHACMHPANAFHGAAEV